MYKLYSSIPTYIYNTYYIYKYVEKVKYVLVFFLENYTINLPHYIDCDHLFRYLVLYYLLVHVRFSIDDNVNTYICYSVLYKQLLMFRL